MYSLQELNVRDKIIWLFRDPRSGSTWFLYRLCLKLKRLNSFIDMENPHVFSLDTDVKYYTDAHDQEKAAKISKFFDARTVEKNDCYKILNTHEYSALESIGKYNNPILFRNVRRNKTQQFVSLIVANQTRIYNVQSLYDRSHFKQLIPFYVGTDQILAFAKRIKQADQLWAQYANDYEKEVIYYEDLQQGYQSKLINLNFLMKPDEDTSANASVYEKNFAGVAGSPLKLPHDYKKIILNYDHVDQILQQELGPY